MNANPLRTIADQIGRLSIGISRTSIRLNHQKRKRKGKIAPNWEEGHGERIWIHSDFKTGLTVYSHSNVLKANKALKQIPFNGKKLKPAKIRKDFWRPLAMIQFPEGLGHVGRSVFHVMREFRMAHNHDWSDETLYHPETGRTLSKPERGARLNDQKANAIADLAAALGGAGKGNKILTSAIEEDSETAIETAPQDADVDGQTGLVKATVYWMNDLDKNYATEWPANVSHARFDEMVQVPIEYAEGSEEVEPSAELLAQGKANEAAEQPRQS